MVPSRVGVLFLTGFSTSVVVSDWFGSSGVNRPSGPRGVSPRLESGF